MKGASWRRKSPPGRRRQDPQDLQGGQFQQQGFRGIGGVFHDDDTELFAMDF